MVTIVITQGDCTLDREDEDKIEFALDEVMTEIGYGDFEIYFE